MAYIKLRQYSGRNNRNYFTTKNGVVHLGVIFCLNNLTIYAKNDPKVKDIKKKKPNNCLKKKKIYFKKKLVFVTFG